MSGATGWQIDKIFIRLKIWTLTCRISTRTLIEFRLIVMQAKNQQSSGLTLHRSTWSQLTLKAIQTNISRHRLISNILKEYLTKNPPEQLQELV